MTTARLPRLYRRMPTVFGPFPGPRQSFDGYRRHGATIRSTEAFVTFTARQADLASLLPSCFAFQKPGPTAFVSIAPKRLDNLDWLAGRGYSLLSVYIHGVQVLDRATRRLCRGTYLPVLWENMADPIVSGREELGFPKLFADLDLREYDHVETATATATMTNPCYSARAHWQGSTFADIQLRGLREEDQEDSGTPRGKRGGGGLAPEKAGIDEGLLLWRYMPATGRPGYGGDDDDTKADADAAYPVFVAYAEEAQKIAQAGQPPPRVVRRRTAQEADVRWYPRDWQALPTLHHIVARLAEIRMLEVTACGLVERLGGGDLSSARRVEIE